METQNGSYSLPTMYIDYIQDPSCSGRISQAKNFDT